jgi:hypothetical protein
VTVKSDWHPWKQYSQSIGREEGMQIDDSDEQCSNTWLSIHDSLDPDSNVTVESNSHPEKQCVQSFSTEAGMQIDESNEQV